VTAPPHADIELPPRQAAVHRRAVWLERLTLVYMASAVVVLYLTLGSSQAMKAAWLEDLLGLLPPASFLVASRVRNRTPSERFPYGYHKVVTIAYLCSALALLALGSYVLYDSVLKLVTAEHPPIGTVTVLGHTVWLGWLMLPALAWSAIPSVFLGRAKLPLAEELHEKVLYADAKMNKANWLTAGAAMVGVVGIGFGLWWADAAAATLISLDIVYDGVTNLRAAVFDLLDSRPARVDGSGPHALIERLRDEARALHWVDDARVRLREEGHVFAGEVLVVPSEPCDLVEEIHHASEALMALDWRLHDLVVVPVPSLDAVEPAAERETPAEASPAG
jgi:cation diffusion facilitator family transporter